LKIGVKYCGGCNPAYDRIKAVETIRRSISEHEFVPFSEECVYGAVLVVCGCSARCAHADTQAKKIIIASEREIKQTVDILT
jgi:3-hydroxyacyl-[acyl-carrier-protein] dehydratase